MRKTLAAMALLMLTAVAAPAMAQRATCQSTPADRAMVAQTVRNMFVAAKRRDVSLWNRSVLPNAYFFDGGHEYMAGALFAAVQNTEAAGHVYVWNPTRMHVEADCQMAWFSEVNMGSVDRKPTVWLESGALKKVGGQWKLAFLESQRAAPKAK